MEKNNKAFSAPSDICKKSENTSIWRKKMSNAEFSCCFASESDKNVADTIDGESIKFSFNRFVMHWNYLDADQLIEQGMSCLSQISSGAW